eukprot:6457243-Amphidinium_carterae.2
MASATTQRILSEQFAALLNILNQTGLHREEERPTLGVKCKWPNTNLLTDRRFHAGPGEVIGPVGILEQGERLASTEGWQLPPSEFPYGEQALGQRLDEETKGEVEVRPALGASPDTHLGRLARPLSSGM